MLLKLLSDTVILKTRVSFVHGIHLWGLHYRTLVSEACAFSSTVLRAGNGNSGCIHFYESGQGPSEQYLIFADQSGADCAMEMWQQCHPFR